MRLVVIVVIEIKVVVAVASSQPQVVAWGPAAGRSVPVAVGREEVATDDIAARLVRRVRALLLSRLGRQIQLELRARSRLVHVVRQ